MTWELRAVDDVECTMDDSGVYVVIHRVERAEAHKEYSGVRILVRADLMASEGDEPIISFIGKANAVRKHLIRYLDRPLSYEHASYIGYELLRAEVTPGYVQD